MRRKRGLRRDLRIKWRSVGQSRRRLRFRRLEQKREEREINKEQLHHKTTRTTEGNVMSRANNNDNNTIIMNKTK